MKKLLLTLFILGAFSCSSSENDVPLELIGTWSLQEVNNDPGDGSGTFLKVKSDKFLIFKKNLEVTSNGSICENSANADSPSKGTYHISQDSEDSGVITSGACEHLSSQITFKLKGTTLYVYYPCIEACVAKYVKK